MAPPQDDGHNQGAMNETKVPEDLDDSIEKIIRFEEYPVCYLRCSISYNHSYLPKDSTRPQRR